MITPSEPVQNKVVLLVDLLGFASLTEEHALQLDYIIESERPLANIAMVLSGKKNPLTETFISFHRALKSAINLAQMHHPVTAITFSDSAFIATNQLYQAVNIAMYFVKALVSQGIPVRAGIAYGTFSAVRFRSDVTLEGGDHAAYFLGTAVVRAHAAETCGIKGIRILLHPSAAKLLKDPQHNTPSPEMKRVYHTDLLGPIIVDNAQPEDKCVRYVECSPEECDNSSRVKYEIDYWRFNPTAESKAWHSLQDMWNSSPQRALHHYEATARAINRMRIAQGEAPLQNLRRRTLPHVEK